MSFHEPQEPLTRPLLKDILIDEFQQFFYRYKKDNIYTYALILDQFQKAQYVCISTQNSIFNESEDTKQYLKEEDKWKIGAWRYKTNLPTEHMSLQAEQLNFKNSLLSEIYSTSGIVQESNNQIDLYLQNMQEAKDYILQIYKLNPDEIIFLVGSAHDQDLLIESAHQLNSPSALLYECIATIKSSSHQHTAGTKLSQSDKDLLIDFAQMIQNLENDDPLQLAQQASLMILDPAFSKSNPYIQNLLHTIAESDSQSFALNRLEVLERIQQFYEI